MPVQIEPVCTQQDLEAFAAFGWRANRADPCWVPPVWEDLVERLDPARNPFWQHAERALWLARRDGAVVGTLGALVDKARVAALDEPVGTFGFFECLPDPEAAQAMFAAAENWLRARGMRSVRGPFNPGEEDLPGILVEGFTTRPALLEAHNPPYYAALLADCGYRAERDLVARLWRRAPGLEFSTQMPGKLMRAAEIASKRTDLRVRQLNPRRWTGEIDLAWQITVDALAALPGFVPHARADFHALAQSFRPIMDPRMALVAELGGKPAGYVLALPDINEALQKVSRRDLPRRLTVVDQLRVLLLARRCRRATLKLLMVKPEVQGRGVEVVLVAALARAIWRRGFAEVDMSLTGDENEKSNRFQDNLGMRVYRRYRIFEKDLTANG